MEPLCHCKRSMVLGWTNQMAQVDRPLGLRWEIGWAQCGKMRQCSVSLCPLYSFKGGSCCLGAAWELLQPSLVRLLERLSEMKSEHPTGGRYDILGRRAIVRCSIPECCSYTKSSFSRWAAQYIPLARGEAQPSTSSDISGLNNWLIHMFGEAWRRSESAWVTVEKLEGPVVMRVMAHFRLPIFFYFDVAIA